MRYLIPIAGGDAMFPKAEFHFPKPLVEIDGVPMVARVVVNLRTGDPAARFIFVVRREDCAEFSLDRTLHIITDGRCAIIQLARPTAGAACSALLASELIDDGEPLVICNGDQILEGGIPAALRAFMRQDFDAGVITFDSVHPRWSYVRTDAEGLVIEAAEKRVISRRAIAGFYYFKRAWDFLRAARASILNERHVDGAYFIAPTLNELVLEGRKVGTFDIPNQAYQSLFSPQRVEHYERHLQNLGRVAGQTVGSDRVNVVIPMAGLGSRFSKAGYTKPKPFIDVAGRLMIERVIDNLALPGARYFLIARADHLEAAPEIAQQLLARGDVEFVSIDNVTEGAACTVLHARPHLDPDTPLLIANCDQIVDFSCADYIEDCRARKLDGSVLSFEDAERNTKWSFARLSDDGLIAEIREKQPISPIATVGIYYFSQARLFIDSALDMIIRNDRVNNEFYVAPVYNYSIAAGGRIGVFMVPAEAMHGIGTPEDLDAFLALRYPS